MSHTVCWVDLPVSDLDRGISFYSKVLDRSLEKQEYEGTAFAFFAHEKGEVAGCLVEKGKNMEPKTDGPLIYFSVNGRLDQAIELAEQNGGTIKEAKHSIGPHGFRAIIMDSEGNRVALHSETE